MTISTSFPCPHCDFSIEVEVEINEGDDLPELCPECSKPLPQSAHDKLAVQAMERAYDRADFHNYD